MNLRNKQGKKLFSHVRVLEYRSHIVIMTVTHRHVLLLDGSSQSVEKDDYIYHGYPVQHTMLFRPDTHKVLVIGKSEGAKLQNAPDSAITEFTQLLNNNPGFYH